MYVIYPKEGISPSDKKMVDEAIKKAAEANPDLQKCRVVVSRSWRSRFEAGTAIYTNKTSYAINFWRRTKTVHIDRSDPDTPEEIERLEKDDNK